MLVKLIHWPIVTYVQLITGIQSTSHYYGSMTWSGSININLGKYRFSTSLSSVKFVFNETFALKCRKLLKEYRESLPYSKLPLGTRIAKVGVISEAQVDVIVKYHETMTSLAAVPDAVEWMAAMSLNRLDITDNLDECAELDKATASVALQQPIVPMSRETPFGMISNESVLLLRENICGSTTTA
ncbi:unnamed protein product [Phytophthora fragariaefolia]|uniref:Unnamed protein product n=1 Tax=Phytophthora fragariaefolia TaxID=1490495 RepID=A0A9W6TSW1_9STRA|nr:unnamed protein product [Phytophthora fragariaefolia]